MTQVYQAVIQKLWRKDIPYLGKKDVDGELLTKAIIDAVGDASRLEQVVHSEIEILGEIATNLTSKNQIAFTTFLKNWAKSARRT